MATISVVDGGPGVDAESLPFLFDSFYQAPGAAGAGGAGVGLSVTRWVIEQHGGQVSARNVEGQGLLIELRLPIAT
jgi:signal transduction histidine kinase